MTPPHTPSRRRFLGSAMQITLAGGLLATGQGALARTASLGQQRSLSFDHLHTNETLSLVYAWGERFVPQSLLQLNTFLRDHYSGDVGSMDPQLFNMLFQIRQALGTRLPFQVISGYRSPHTNETLRETRGGGVARRSLHMDGKAIDMRMEGVPLQELRDAAWSLQAGGVGMYSRDNFVHVDTGRVREWGD